MDIRLLEDNTALEVFCSDKHLIRHSARWLRFHCGCKACVPLFSGIYTIDKTDFDDNLRITSAEILESDLRLEVENEKPAGHVTSIPIEWLRKNCNCGDCLRTEFKKSDMRLSDPKTTPLPRKPYSLFATNEGKFEILQTFFDVGFCILENVPTVNKTVLEVAKQFGTIRATTYGKIYNVGVRTKPENASYTTMQLPFHQDQPCYEVAPGVQLLHALEFDESIKGGESQLCDLFYAAEILRQESQEDFDILCRIPATFSVVDYERDHPVWLQNIRTHLELDYFGNLVSINWHGTMEGTLRVPHADEEAYYKARNHFQEIIHRPENEFFYRMKKGDMAIFNNRRMAHARKAFDASEGRRLLQGTYVNLDDMKSGYMTLAQKLGKQVVSPKCGTRSWS